MILNDSNLRYSEVLFFYKILKIDWKQWVFLAFWETLLYSVREKKTYAKSAFPAMQESCIGSERGVSDDESEGKAQ